MVTIIQTPSDAVEFYIDSLNLAVGNGEEIESLDFVLCTSDSGEVPVPNDLTATGWESLDRMDTFDRWSVENTVDVVLLLGEGITTKLMSLATQNHVSRIYVLTGRPCNERILSDTSVKLSDSKA